jgi:nicotinamide mononucleotide adenylyltransferase
MKYLCNLLYNNNNNNNGVLDKHVKRKKCFCCGRYGHYRRDCQFKKETKQLLRSTMLNLDIQQANLGLTPWNINQIMDYYNDKFFRDYKHTSDMRTYIKAASQAVQQAYREIFRIMNNNHHVNNGDKVVMSNKIEALTDIVRSNPQLKVPIKADISLDVPIKSHDRMKIKNREIDYLKIKNEIFSKRKERMEIMRKMVMRIKRENKKVDLGTTITDISTATGSCSNEADTKQFPKQVSRTAVSQKVFKDYDEEYEYMIMHPEEYGLKVDRTEEKQVENDVHRENDGEKLIAEAKNEVEVEKPKTLKPKEIKKIQKLGQMINEYKEYKIECMEKEMCDTMDKIENWLIANENLLDEESKRFLEQEGIIKNEEQRKDEFVEEMYIAYKNTRDELGDSCFDGNSTEMGRFYAAIFEKRYQEEKKKEEELQEDCR